MAIITITMALTGGLVIRPTRAAGDSTTRIVVDFGTRTARPYRSYEGAQIRIQALDPVRYFNWHQRGYARCEVTRQEWRTDFRLVESVSEPESPISTVSSWRIEVGHPGATVPPD